MVTTRPPKTIVKPTALGPVANTDTKLLIYGLFQKGRVLAQDDRRLYESYQSPPTGNGPLFGEHAPETVFDRLISHRPKCSEGKPSFRTLGLVVESPVEASQIQCDSTAQSTWKPRSGGCPAGC